MHTSSLTVAILLPLALARAAPKVEERGCATCFYGDYTGHTSQYADGSGTYVTSNDDHHYASGVHCWTDQFTVSTTSVAENWARSGVSIDCATTSNCNTQTATGTNHCWSWTLTETIGLSLDVIKDLFSFSSDTSLAVSDQQCTTSSLSETCTWSDQGCHTLWTSDVQFVNIGYIRRRCDDGGDHTVWSQDFNVTVPGKETRVGCAATCDMNSYPSAVPLPPQ